MKKALILDLDNTIYPVSSIAGNLFDELFRLIDLHAGGSDHRNIDAAKNELTKRPYQLVADEFNFDAELTAKGIALLKNMEYSLPMHPFEDYHQIRSHAIQKFLVTTGFSKLQWSKVKMLGIEADFEEIHIVDPEVSRLTKKDVFAGIMKKHNYTPADMLVAGDDPASEIKAATALGIDTFLFDPENRYPDAVVTSRSRDLSDVLKYI